MNIKSDKFNCYIEGIRLPLNKIQFEISANQFSQGIVEIPLSIDINTKSFASALVQTTYIKNNQEFLFYEGICNNLSIDENNSILTLILASKFSVFNFNSTLDYMSPKKYGFQNMDEGLTIYLGNEDATTISTSDFGLTNNLSDRYFLMVDETIDELNPLDPESNKLMYIMNRYPFAERFAYAFFEDIQYNNFILSKAYIDRFNLLGKSKTKLRQDLATQQGEGALVATTGYEIRLDLSRSGLQAYIDDLQNISTDAPETTTGFSGSGTPVVQSNDKGTLASWIKSDPRKQYLQSYRPDNHQYCTSATAKALLAAAELIYKTYNTPVLVGDISILNANGDWIGHGWGGHAGHQRGTKVDLTIEGATNSLRADYNFNKAIGCLKIFSQTGATRIGFQDHKRQADLSRLSGADVRDWHGHEDHFHVEYE